VPDGFDFAKDNTEEEQAEWDVQAFQLMREWGIVRLAFCGTWIIGRKVQGRPIRMHL
jgi:hypothetical protein